MSGFTFDNRHCSDLYIKSIRTNPVLVAEKKHEFIEIPNKAGSVLVRDNKPMDTTEIITCWYERPSNVSVRSYGRMLDDWLTTANWGKLIFDDDSTYYREAIHISSITFDDIRLNRGEFEISFRCRPTFIEVGE